jgi:hypothetical protein
LKLLSGVVGSKLKHDIKYFGSNLNAPKKPEGNTTNRCRGRTPAGAIASQFCYRVVSAPELGRCAVMQNVVARHTSKIVHHFEPIDKIDAEFDSKPRDAALKDAASEKGAG